MEAITENRSRGKNGCMKRIGITVIVLVAGLLGLWLYWFPTFSWHQKMTVEVEVNGQVYSGSSVVKMIVKGYREPLRLTGRARHLSMQGEAVVIELPEERYLFALLTYDAYLTGKVFHDLVGGVITQPEKGWASDIQHVRETRDLDGFAYPLLVTFVDITDPTSVKEVDPNNLASTLGSGVSLKRVTLGITDEPVTEGKIESVLGWYWDYRKYGYRLNGKKCVACPVSSENLADLIGTGEFKIGGNK